MLSPPPVSLWGFSGFGFCLGFLFLFLWSCLCLLSFLLFFLLFSLLFLLLFLVVSSFVLTVSVLPFRCFLSLGLVGFVLVLSFTFPLLGLRSSLPLTGLLTVSIVLPFLPRLLSFGLSCPVRVGAVHRLFTLRCYYGYFI